MAENLSRQNSGVDGPEIIASSVAAAQRELGSTGARLNKEDAYAEALLMQDFSARMVEGQKLEIERCENFIKNAQQILFEHAKANSFLITNNTVIVERNGITREKLVKELEKQRATIDKMKANIPRNEVAAYDQFTKEQGI